MPYGAHETMEMHECLMEKINCITHFNLYARATRNPQLLDIIVRHQAEEIRTYNEIVACARGNSQFNPVPPYTDIRGINNQQIQYGVNNPPQFAPQSDAVMNDMEIAMAVLHWHKAGARQGLNASLECADPNVRRLLLNSVATCVNQAYECFLFLNQQGVYQVPTLQDNTAQTFLQSYQPADQAMMAQYGIQAGQNAGYYGNAPAGRAGQTTGYYGNATAGRAGGTTGYYGNTTAGGTGQNAGYYSNATAGSSGSTMNVGLNVGSADSVLYGAGGAGTNAVGGGVQATQNVGYNGNATASSAGGTMNAGMTVGAADNVTSAAGGAGTGAADRRRRDTPLTLATYTQ